MMNRRFRKITMILFAFAAVCISARLMLGNSDQRNQSTLHVAVVEDSAYNLINVHNLDYLSACKKGFEGMYPGVSVYIEIIPANTYSDWLFSRLLEGNMPDIFSVSPRDFYLLASMDTLESMDDPRFAEDIPANITDAWRYEGDLYAVPYYTSPPCLIVNKDLFPENTIEFELNKFNWMSLIYYCKYHTTDLNSDGIIDFFGLSNMDWRKAAYFNGARLFDPVAKKSYFTSPGTNYAVKYAVDINKANIDNYNRSFENNRSMIKVSNLSEAFYYLSVYPDRDLQIFPIPRGPDGSLLAEPYDTPLAVYKKSGNKKAAVDFLKFITLDEENQVSLFANGASFPVLRSAMTSDKLTSKINRGIDSERLDAILNNIAPVKIDFSDYYVLMDIADKEIFQYIKNELNIDEELVLLDKQLATIMNSSP